MSTVLSGDYVAIQTVVAKLHKDHGTKARKVRTTHADHSPHMQTIANSLAHKVDDILEPSSRALERLGLSGEDDEKFSFVTIASTVSGTTIPPHLLRTGDYWGHHMTGAVRFVDALKALVGTASVFVDVGDGMMQMFGKGTLETVKDKSAYCWMSSLSSKGEKDAEHFDAALKQVVAWRDNPCESDEVSDPGTGTKIIPETVSSDLGKVDISECKIMPTPQQLQCDPAMTKSTKKDENKMSFSVTMPRGASFENLVAFLESQYEMGLEVYDALRLTSESKKMRPVPMRDDQDFKAALELAAR